MDNFFNDKKQKIENKTKEKVAKLSKEEKQQFAIEYRRGIIIGGIIIGLILLGMFLACVIGLATSNNASSMQLIVYTVVLVMIIAAWLFYVIACYKKSDEEAAYLYVKGKYSKEIKEEAKKDVEGDSLPADFSITRRVPLATNGYQKNELLLDSNSKKIVFLRGGIYSKVVRFSDVLNYEVYENGASKVMGTAGKTMIGGAFFGLGGALVAGNMGRKVKETCNQLKLIIRFKNLDNPQIELVYVDNVNWDKEGFSYRTMKENLQLVCSLLEVIINDNEIETNYKTKQVVNSSKKDKLIELKDLLENDLITQEDFDRKKEEILNS